MDTIDSNELWRKIPVEEKLSLVADAQGQGVLTFFSCILLSAAFAIALQSPWVFWLSFLFAPFAFQFASGRRYRQTKPVVMLSYLAARSVARRFAYTLNHDDLTLRLLFRGYGYRPMTPQENVEGDNELEPSAKVPVWIALFGSSVVILTEQAGGAKPIFKGILNEKFDLSMARGELGEYEREKELELQYEDRKIGPQKVVIGSAQAAALITFERVCTSELERAIASTVELPS